MRLVHCSLLIFTVVAFGCDPEVTGGGDTTSSSSSSSSSTSSGMGGGGAAGNGGSGGSGGTVDPSLPECVEDSDCTLISDCCQCAGVPSKDPLPECPGIECFAPTCDSIGLPSATAVCRAGRCVVDADCNHGHALCDSLPPTCPPGQTAFVSNGCWGGCINATECREIGSCTQCPNEHACVENVAFTVERHCVSVPADCTGQVNCACMGSFTCIQPYGACIDTSAPVLMCECPTC